MRRKNQKQNEQEKGTRRGGKIRYTDVKYTSVSVEVKVKYGEKTVKHLHLKKNPNAGRDAVKISNENSAREREEEKN